MKKIYILAVLGLGLFGNSAIAQSFYRIKGEFSIKSKSTDGKSQLTMGTFYYDKNFGKLIYKNTFPAKDVWVTYDTVMYNIVNDRVVRKILVPPLAQFSVFHLALTSQINNYGLKQSGFTIQKVEKAQDMVITTWIPPAYLKKMFGKVLTSIRSNRLNGIVFMDAKGNVLRKQFFNNFTNVKGVEIPLEIIDMTYANGRESYQVTTYKNIVIDEVADYVVYNYPIPFN